VKEQLAARRVCHAQVLQVPVREGHHVSHSVAPAFCKLLHKLLQAQRTQERSQIELQLIEALVVLRAATPSITASSSSISSIGSSNLSHHHAAIPSTNTLPIYSCYATLYSALSYYPPVIPLPPLNLASVSRTSCTEPKNLMVVYDPLVQSGETKHWQHMLQPSE
jgi:hypothetical protein